MSSLSIPRFLFQRYFFMSIIGPTSDPIAFQEWRQHVLDKVRAWITSDMQLNIYERQSDPALLHTCVQLTIPKETDRSVAEPETSLKPFLSDIVNTFRIQDPERTQRQLTLDLDYSHALSSAGSHVEPLSKIQ